MECLFITLILSIIILYTIINLQESNFSNPCTDYLSDNEFLEHMIPHHQVAVDMSKKLLNHTKNDFMIYLAYRIIQAQQNEIILLHDLKKKINYRHQSELVI